VLTNHYWWIPEALTPQQCDEIQHAAALEQQIEGIHFGQSEEHRKSQISWIYNEKINDLVSAWIRQANKEAGWSFDLHKPEALQYTRYSVDGYYDWHIDGNSDNHAARRLLPSSQIPDPIPLNLTPFPELQGTVRKLSATVNLSHSSDYEGGEFQIRCYDKLHRFNDAERGSIAVFPSFMDHRVTPVTSGERHSAVMWYNGYPFR
jgi:PKHD-type hydroxylase